MLPLDKIKVPPDTSPNFSHPFPMLQLYYNFVSIVDFLCLIPLQYNSIGGEMPMPNGPKRFQGTKTFNSYKELCAFLEIDPAPRGTARQKQLEELRRSYKITKHKSGRYDITYLTKPTRKRKEGIASGQIQTIDGVKVDLESPTRYKHTRIDDYILYCALNADTETMRDFQIQCFNQSNYYYKLLNREYSGPDDLDSLQGQYDTFILDKADELICGRLDDRVDYRLKKLEEKKYIKVWRCYLLSNKSTVSVESVKPYVKKALKKLGCKNEYYAFRSKAIREKYIELRNEYFQKGTGTDLEIRRKELHITPLLSPDDDRYPKLTQEQCAEILSHFFNVFRANIRYDLTHPKIDRKTGEEKKIITIAKIPARLKKGVQEEAVEEQVVSKVSEVIEKYCTYEATSNNIAVDTSKFNYYAVSGLERETEDTSSET